jgi:hypothetical protein
MMPIMGSIALFSVDGGSARERILVVTLRAARM